ncbi:MAG TPA: SPASM domain-containing protein [Elusimicrobiales bacterium]|nr:SPASM domain-containing protein [Elusimicrobiales bacterium]
MADKTIEQALSDLIVSRRGSSLDWSSRIKANRLYKLASQGQWLKLLNYVSGSAAGALRLKHAPNKPYFLSLDPTNACQLKCPFCIGGRRHGNDFISFDIYERLMRRLGPTLLKIDFCKGAEPLLHPRICDMVRLAKSYGLETVIASNLNHIPDPEQLLSCGLDLLMMSIDGLTQETYSRYRAGGDCAKAMSHMELLAHTRKRLGKNSPFLVWNYLVFKHNEHEIPQVVEKARQIGVDSVTFMTPSIPNDPQTRQSWQSTLPQFQDYGQSSRDKYCYWPWGGLDVRPDGKVAICYGHAQEQLLCSTEELLRDFANIWNGPKMRAARRGVALNGTTRSDGTALECCRACPGCGCSNFTV